MGRPWQLVYAADGGEKNVGVFFPNCQSSCVRLEAPWRVLLSVARHGCEVSRE